MRGWSQHQREPTQPQAHQARAQAVVQHRHPCLEDACRERTFAWEEKLKRLLLRFERSQQRHYGMKLLAYTLINLRGFCGVQNSQPVTYLVSGVVVIGGPPGCNKQLPYIWLLHGA